MRATIRDVAKAAGVSVATVSYVLNGQANITEATKQKVLEAVKALDYHPNRAAQALANRRTETIALLLPPKRSAADPFLYEFLSGAVDAATRQGYALLLTPAGQPLAELVKQGSVDGLLLMEAEEQDARIDFLLAADFPFLLFGRSPEHPEIVAIDVDNRLGALLATRHLLELGHRRIGFIGAEPRFIFGRLRREGYRAALREAGVQPDGSLETLGELSEPFGYAAARSLLSLAEPPTALFCSSDLAALGALRALAEAGITVPDQVSLVGYDNTPIATYAQPALTTVAQPIYELGSRAVQRLLELLAGQGPPPGLVVVEPELIIRSSTGPLGPG